MKIKKIQLQDYRTYKNWQFEPAEKGVNLLYGPNESGKTTLLEGLRGLLFGLQGRDRKDSQGSIEIDYKGEPYRIKRDGKKLEFYELGKDMIDKEPAEEFWHNLDRKTYEKIFAITLEDMQGIGIIDQVDVRTRFFGAKGGEKLSETVKEIQKASGELLVASANGKRKINTLLKQLKDLEVKIKELGANEEEYVELRRKIEATVKTEEELQKSLAQWQEYYKSVELVQRSWETYERAEEAQSKMNSLMQGSVPNQERFMELDNQINQCHEYMRIWKGKEEGLLPDKFTPNDLVGIYAKDIEALHEQLGKWEQLQKDCKAGEKFLKGIKEQLGIAKATRVVWQTNAELPKDVDWHKGQELAKVCNNLKHAQEQWALRAPIDLENAYMLTEKYKQEKEAAKQAQIAKIDEEIKIIDRLEKSFFERSEYAANLYNMSLSERRGFWAIIVALISGALAVASFILLKDYTPEIRFASVGGLAVLGAVCLALGMKWRVGVKKLRDGAITLNRMTYDVNYSAKKFLNDVKLNEQQAEEIIEVINELGKEQIENKKHAYKVGDQPAMIKLLPKVRAMVEAKYAAVEEAVETEKDSSNQVLIWEEEGEKLRAQVEEAENNWRNWLPKGANVTCTADTFFALKEEYDNYMDQKAQYEGYIEQLNKHEATLSEIEEEAKILWAKVKFEEEITPVGLRKLHRHLKNYQDNKARWEQKESQRKNYREEYDKWHCKEKDLLIQQDEILKKGGFESAVEFRKKMISIEQYRQWETIAKQSKVQLNLLAPDQEVYDLLLRRLREGDKEKWANEEKHSLEQIKKYEKQLANLYEKRGTLVETMRQLGEDNALAKALQKQSQLEEELETLLEEWATNIYVEHLIETAQQKYESERQPQVIDIASEYLNTLTNNRYTLANDGAKGAVVLHDENNNILDSDNWSSGLSDQVYLALRLSLAKRFGQEVDPMPIILDDIFVRFDEGRQKAALKVLAELSETEQIFVFTCQEQLMRLAQEVNDERIKMFRFKDDKSIEAY